MSGGWVLLKAEPSCFPFDLRLSRVTRIVDSAPCLHPRLRDHRHRAPRAVCAAIHREFLGKGEGGEFGKLGRADFGIERGKRNLEKNGINGWIGIAVSLDIWP